MKRDMHEQNGFSGKIISVKLFRIGVQQRGLRITGNIHK